MVPQPTEPPPRVPLLSSLWYELVYVLCSVGMTVTHSLRVEGTRNVPRTGPLLVIANHQSFLDPALAGVAVRRHLVYLARKTLFRNPFFRGLIRSLRAVPIDQDGIGKDGIKAILGQLALGRAVLVFPEGVRTDDGTVHPLRPGVHLLVKRTKAPILPIGIAGAFDAWPRWQSFPSMAPVFMPAGKATIAVSVGRPLDAGRYASMSRDQALGELHHALQSQWARAEDLRRK